MTINGVQGTVGGDVITAIDGQTINSMSDIIAYLAIHTQVGQTVTLTILRDGQDPDCTGNFGQPPNPVNLTNGFSFHLPQTLMV